MFLRLHARWQQLLSLILTCFSHSLVLSYRRVPTRTHPCQLVRPRSHPCQLAHLHANDRYWGPQYDAWLAAIRQPVPPHFGGGCNYRLDPAQIIALHKVGSACALQQSYASSALLHIHTHTHTHACTHTFTHAHAHTHFTNTHARWPRASMEQSRLGSIGRC
jgi:hypothetical protein